MPLTEDLMCGRLCVNYFSCIKPHSTTIKLVFTPILKVSTEGGGEQALRLQIFVLNHLCAKSQLDLGVSQPKSPLGKCEKLVLLGSRMLLVQLL